jgi:hypothetical protein
MLATAIIIKCGCWDDLALGMVSEMILIVAEKAFPVQLASDGLHIPIDL